jgi:MYXO-CTERM domain-containing protein
MHIALPALAATLMLALGAGQAAAQAPGSPPPEPGAPISDSIGAGPPPGTAVAGERAEMEDDDDDGFDLGWLGLIGLAGLLGLRRRPDAHVRTTDHTTARRP